MPPSPDAARPVGPALLWGVAALAVAVAVAGALAVTGGPRKQRAYRLDEQRVDRLRSVQSVLNDYYEEREDLPTRLDAEAIRHVVGRLPDLLDPETGTPFAYERIDAGRYRLCARFALPSPALGRLNEYFSSEDRWRHPAGKHCFPLKVDNERWEGHGDK